MNEPIQNTSADIKIKPEEPLTEPFIKAIEKRKYEILFFQDNKAHPFFCSGYDINKLHYDYGQNGITGEWLFTDVIMDTSKRDSHGNITLVRLSYHPQISLVNVPFMVLPAGEKENHIPEDTSVLPIDEDLKDDDL
jgi:hypothetical protein